MKQIDVSTKKHPNTFALVDDSDYKELNKHHWFAFGQGSGNLRVRRHIKKNGKWVGLKMHIAIMGRVDGKEIDHKNGNALDNQRKNLRHCTHAENLRNRGVTVNSTSGFKGVYWCKGNKKWRTYIKYCGKMIYCGHFFCLIKAAKAYNTAASKYFGEFARLNEIPEICCLAKENSND
jgi:hypothetical protein